MYFRPVFIVDHLLYVVLLVYFFVVVVVFESYVRREFSVCQ
jgi:hypothetical protein